MFTFIKNVLGFNSKENDMTGRIQKLPTGKFALVARGESLGFYTRRRDAVRGAKRRGVMLMEQAVGA